MFRIDDENLLLIKLREGSREAFNELYDEYRNKLIKYISFFTRNQEKSEDIVQQVMMKIWDKREILNISTSLKYYLFRASYNEFVSSEKKHGKVSLMEEIVLESYAETEEDSPEYQHKINFILTEIEQLPQKCKEVFILNKMNGLKYREIAEKLNVSEKTVENHIGNALKKIREAAKNARGG